MLTSPKPVRRGLTVALATAVLAAPVALAAPAALAAPRADAAKPNERAPRVQDAPESGEAPWATSVANDMVGYRASTYTGKFYMKSWEQFRLCVLERESNGFYPESSGAHTGGYQMTATLKAQAVKKLMPEIRALYGAPGVAALEQMRSQPLHRWNRYWQDAAFWAVLGGPGGPGWGHWHWKWNGRWKCLPGANKESGWPKSGTLRQSNAPTPSASTDTQPTTATKPQTRGGTPKSNQRLARNYISSTYGWGKKEFRALKKHWFKESNWLHTVINPMGPWHGLGQVNGRFIRDQGYTIRQYMASPLIQIKVGTAYIKQRYGTPISAWQHFRANGWY